MPAPCHRHATAVSAPCGSCYQVPSAYRRVLATDQTRRDRHVIAYLAFSGILLALGVDIALPAYDEIAPAVGLDPESSSITLIITVYLLGIAAGQLIWGPIADRFGRQPAMMASVALYVIGALASALAPSMALLLTARAIWGIGAAGPAMLRATIARDLYEGDQMARMMSLVMAIFMAGPILAPLLGEVLLIVGTWRWVFVFCALAGGVQLLWSKRFGETLDPADVQPLTLTTTAKAFRRVLTTRETVAYTLALSFAYGSFYIFLGSTQRVMSNIYDLGDWFAVTFAASGVVMAGGFFAVNRLISAFGARKVSITGMAGFAIVGVVFLSVVLVADGRPPFWVWIVGITVLNQLAIPLGPSCFTLGLEPMGDLAGTASAVMGFLSNAIAAGLAAFIDQRIGSSVTPMAAGYLVYGSIALAGLVAAQPRLRTRRTQPEPAKVA